MTRRFLAVALVYIVLISAVVFAATQDRLPTGDSSGSNTWTASSAGSKFEDVDDPIGTPDDDTTYISIAESGGAQQFTFSAFDIPNGATINSVSVLFRCKSPNGGDVTLRPRVRVGGTDNGHSPLTMTTSYANYTRSFTTNPVTTVAWTEADVEGTGANPLQEFGVTDSGSISAGESVQCTQIYATVDYTGGSAGTSGRILLLGVGGS